MAVCSDDQLTMEIMVLLLEVELEDECVDDCERCNDSHFILICCLWGK